VRRLALVATLLSLAAPAAAEAHPLGNFTVNRYAAVQLSGGGVYVHYVLDVAEIPTFQEGDRLRRADFAETIARGLVLRVDGAPAALRVVRHEIVERPGAGGLPTLRFEAVLTLARPLASGDGGQRTLVVRDTNFAGRIGWREVVARADEGARIRSASVPPESRSDALRAYPKELLQSPLDVGSARISFVPGAGPGTPPALDTARATEEGRGRGGFEALIAQGDLSLGVVLVSLAVAMFWGAAHALTPGHGKAIVAGYLVGTRGKARHAFLLGGIVTVTHTAGVFALGLVTLLLSRFIVPERLYPWLTVASGVLVIAVGASVLVQRLRHRGAHAHAHDHHHDHGGKDEEQGVRGLLGVGIAAGLLPCPSALVVLLSAIALHRVGFGLALIVAFSAGLALTVSSIGLVAVLARKAFGRLRLDGPVFRALPALSALVILAVGIAITVNSLPEVL